jgi:tetratricopeptide (TPR) repeat protein
MGRVLMEPTKRQLDVTEEEIEVAEKLRGQGEYAMAHALTQDMLNRTKDDGTRMRLLFDVINCSTALCLKNITEDAMRELEKLPKPEFSRVLANSIRANAEIDLNRPQEALALIDMNLETGYFERDDFRIHKYDLCHFKGRALARMWRWDEALDWLDKAHAMYPSEVDITDEDTRKHVHWAEARILLNKAYCFIGLKRFDEAFELSKQVYESEDGWEKTRAMQQMADCRLWQGRAADALKLYVDVKKRLPCSAVSDKYIQDRIVQCMDYIEKYGPHSKPS